MALITRLRKPANYRMLQTPEAITPPMPAPKNFRMRKNQMVLRASGIKRIPSLESDQCKRTGSAKCDRDVGNDLTKVRFRQRI